MKGRKKTIKNVVPLRGESVEQNVLHAEERAQQLAVDLRPAGLSDAVAVEWGIVAPILAAPHLDRLKPHYVPAVVEMCSLMARIREIRTLYPKITDETYTVKGRNGTQEKLYPHIAQLNDAQRQLRGFFAAFGMTPADERNLAPGQLNLFDPAAQYLD